MKKTSLSLNIVFVGSTMITKINPTNKKLPPSCRKSMFFKKFLTFLLLFFVVLVELLFAAAHVCVFTVAAAKAFCTCKFVVSFVEFVHVNVVLTCVNCNCNKFLFFNFLFFNFWFFVCFCLFIFIFFFLNRLVKQKLLDCIKCRNRYNTPQNLKT